VIHLLDVSLLIALLDQNHVHHEVARRWFGRVGKHGWATCPITENGFLRILSSASYPIAFESPDSVFGLLREFCLQKGHHFWPDDFSLLDVSEDFSSESISSRDITDFYLLALAVRNKGKFATLDGHVPADLIAGGAESLLLIGR
jgi:toxin-antitoxin system PIN domain toxin